MYRHPNCVLPAPRSRLRQLSARHRRERTVATQLHLRFHCGTDSTGASLEGMCRRPSAPWFLVVLMLWQVASGVLAHASPVSHPAESAGLGQSPHCAGHGERASPTAHRSLGDHQRSPLPTHDGPNDTDCCASSPCAAACAAIGPYLPTLDVMTPVCSEQFTDRMAAASTFDNRVFDFFRPPI